jgi:hypothetical protein
MGLEWSDGDAHPLVERQRTEQTIEFDFGVSAIQPEDLGLAEWGGSAPDPQKMPFIHQLGCGGRLGVLAFVDLRLWSSLRHLDLEFD